MGRDVTIGELLAHTFVALFSVLNIAVLIECIGDIAGKSLCKIVILKGKKK